MALLLESLDVAGDYLSDHQPERLDFFSLHITVNVSSSNQDGCSMYQLHVCTPEWLSYSLKYTSTKGALWGRHLLIVDIFDPNNIQVLIQDKLKSISEDYSGDNSVNLFEKFSRYAHWEFEDYIPSL